MGRRRRAPLLCVLPLVLLVLLAGQSRAAVSLETTISPLVPLSSLSCTSSASRLSPPAHTDDWLLITAATGPSALFTCPRSTACSQGALFDSGTGSGILRGNVVVIPASAAIDVFWCANYTACQLSTSITTTGGGGGRSFAFDGSLLVIVQDAAFNATVFSCSLGGVCVERDQLRHSGCAVAVASPMVMLGNDVYSCAESGCTQLAGSVASGHVVTAIAASTTEPLFLVVTSTKSVFLYNCTSTKGCVQGVGTTLDSNNMIAVSPGSNTVALETILFSCPSMEASCSPLSVSELNPNATAIALLDDRFFVASPIPGSGSNAYQVGVYVFSSDAEGSSGSHSSSGGSDDTVAMFAGSFVVLGGVICMSCFAFWWFWYRKNGFGDGTSLCYHFMIKYLKKRSSRAIEWRHRDRCHPSPQRLGSNTHDELGRQQRGRQNMTGDPTKCIFPSFNNANLFFFNLASMHFSLRPLAYRLCTKEPGQNFYRVIFR